MEKLSGESFRSLSEELDFWMSVFDVMLPTESFLMKFSLILSYGPDSGPLVKQK